METVSTTHTKKYRQLIAGEWVAAATQAIFDDMNPYDNTVFAHIPASSEVDAQLAINAAAKAFPAWAAMGARERQGLFLKAADILVRRQTTAA